MMSLQEPLVANSFNLSPSRGSCSLSTIAAYGALCQNHRRARLGWEGGSPAAWRRMLLRLDRSDPAPLLPRTRPRAPIVLPRHQRVEPSAALSRPPVRLPVSLRARSSLAGEASAAHPAARASADSHAPSLSLSLSAERLSAERLRAERTRAEHARAAPSPHARRSAPVLVRGPPSSAVHPLCAGSLPSSPSAGPR